MYRGNDSFTTMKGFLGDMTIKGDGHELETLPPGEEGDITESAELDNALPGGALSAANIKPTDNKTGSPSTTMDPELDEVADKAVQDIAQGYDADVQNLPGPGDREKKGYEVYNDMVAKGAAINVQPFNRFDVDGSMNMIEKSAQGAFELGLSQLSPWMTKGMDNDLSLKGIVFKGDPEDMSLEDGYVEDGAPNGSVEEADDDTESTQGENEEDPQSLAAEADDDEGDVANPATLADDGTQKGWASYNHGMAVKGFAMEEKGPRMSAAWQRAKDAGSFVKDKATAAGKYAKEKASAANKATTEFIQRHPKKVAGGALGVGLVGGAAAGRESKGFDDGMVIYKGLSFGAMVTKAKKDPPVNVAPKTHRGGWKPSATAKSDDAIREAMAAGDVIEAPKTHNVKPRSKFAQALGWGKRGATAVGEHLSKNRKYYIPAAVGAAALGGAAAGAYGSKKKEMDEDGMTIFKGESGVNVVEKGLSRAKATALGAIGHGIQGAGAGAIGGATSSDKGEGWRGAGRGALAGGALGTVVGGVNAGTLSKRALGATRLSDLKKGDFVRAGLSNLGSLGGGAAAGVYAGKKKKKK